MSGFFQTVLTNEIVLSVLLAYALASLIKVFFHYLGTDKWDWMVFFRTGGMPSSHTASVTAMATSIYLLEGPSNLFMVCLIVASIVISDAIGLRRSVGKQAQVLNKMSQEIRHFRTFRPKRVQELLGHTPKQALAGLVLGILVANLVFIF